MRSERSVRVLVPARRVTRRLSDGIAAGKRAADRARQLEGAIGQQDVVDIGAQLRPRLRGLVDGVVGARQRAVGVREDEELEVTVALHAGVEPVENLGQRHGRVDAAQREGRDRLQGDLGDDPEGAHRDASGEQVVAAVDLADLAGGGHQAQRAHLRGQVAQRDPRPVRGGRDRARDRLLVDVAQVGQRQPALGERVAQSVQRHPGLDADQAGRAVGVQQRAHAIQAQERAVGEDGARERVSRARDAHAAPGGDGALDRADDLADRGGALDDGRLAALIAGPVAPHGAHASVRGMIDSDETQLEVSVEHTAVAMADGSAQVVDVREPYERDAGHIVGTVHIALGELASEAESLERERPVIFYCHSGSRSLMAAAAFRQAGFEAYSMAGGIDAWEQEGRPVQGNGA